MITLLKDYLRRSWMVGVLGALGLFGFHWVACRVFLQIQQQGSGLPLTKLVPQWVQSAFNIGPSTVTELSGFLSVCYQHPFVVTVMLGVPVALITGFFTGDVERRTLAMVLVRPVARLKVVAAVALVVVFWLVIGLLAQWAGVQVGAKLTNQAANLNHPALRLAAVALGSLVFSFTGIVALLSTLLSVRGDSVGWAVTVVLIMYVWNFLAQVWKGAAGFANYSLFGLYKPTDILLHGLTDWRATGILALVGLIGWLGAAVAFRLRSFDV